jgi:hypothetical protein
MMMMTHHGNGIVVMMGISHCLQASGDVPPELQSISQTLCDFCSRAEPHSDNIQMQLVID